MRRSSGGGSARFAVADPPPASWQPPVPWWAWGLLIASTILVYANSLPNGFHYDDLSMIVHNPAVHNVDRIPSHFVSVTIGNVEETPSYRPLLMATYALNYAWGRTDPRGYHVVNIVLHLIGACLVILLVWQLTANGLAAYGAGLWFALNPVQTEAVNYITARSSLLYAVLSLTTVILFIRFRRAQTWWMLGAASLAYAGALLSKEAAAVVPALLVGYDVIVRRCGWRDLTTWMRPHAPFVLLTLALVGFRRVLMGSVIPPAYHGDLATVIPTFAAIVAKTLRDQLAPIDLSASHAFGPIRSLTPDALVALGVVAGLGAVVVFLRRHVPLAAFAAWWFPVCLLPLAVLPLITSLALYQENRGYLSAVAVAMLGGPLMAWWWGAGATRAMLFRRGLLVVVFVTMAVAVVQRNPVWLDDLTLWTDVLKKAPGNQAAYVNVGAAYQARGDFDEAAEVYRRALERFPNNGILHNNLGVIYRSHGDLDRAAEAFQAAIRVSPGFAMPYFNLGLLLQGAGYRAEAIASYQRFLELAPGQQGTPASILKARQHLNELRGTAGEPAGASPLSN